MQVMTQQPGESPLPDAVPLDGIAPTPPSLVVRVQTSEPLSSEHSAPSLDSADVERLRRVSALSRAICRLGAAPEPREKLRAASLLRTLVLHRPDASENCGT